MKTQAIVISCHEWHESTVHLYKRIEVTCSRQFDIFILFDNTYGKYRPISGSNDFLFTLNDPHFHKYNIHSKSMWYNQDYPLILFSLNYDKYQTIWRIEYDVDFIGNWMRFFGSLQYRTEDMLATYVRNINDDPTWPHWNSASFVEKIEEYWCCFFPVVRISRKALMFLDKKYKEGNHGFCELTCPTLLQNGGFFIGDIGRLHYNFWTFSFESFALSIPNKLRHPVKRIKFSKRVLSTVRRIRLGYVP